MQELERVGIWGEMEGGYQLRFNLTEFQMNIHTDILCRIRTHIPHTHPRTQKHTSVPAPGSVYRRTWLFIISNQDAQDPWEHFNISQQR